MWKRHSISLCDLASAGAAASGVGKIRICTLERNGSNFPLKGGPASLSARMISTVRSFEAVIIWSASKLRRLEGILGLTLIESIFHPKFDHCYFRCPHVRHILSWPND